MAAMVAHSDSPSRAAEGLPTRLMVNARTRAHRRHRTHLWGRGLARFDDHTASTKSVLRGSTVFGGEVTSVHAGSSHIAGVFNPPDRQKYQHWTGLRPAAGDSFGDWVAEATEPPDSWWPHWVAWIREQDGTEVAAWAPGIKAFPVIEDASGDM